MRADIRPFTPDDYPGIVSVHNAVYPDYPETPDEWRFNDEHRDPKCRWRRWVVERDGQVAAVGGYGQWSEMYHPRKFTLDLAVRPERQGEGIGASLYRHVLEALAPFDPLSVSTDAREDMARGIAFLEKRGFRETMREWESRLDVAAFDPAPFAGVAEKVRAQGIEIKTLRELESDPERDRKIYALDWEVSQDVPSPEPPTKTDFGIFIERTLKSPNLLPDAYFVAVDGGRYVGLSVLWRCQASDDLDTGLTGVSRDYRRRGIALALKLRAIDYARRQKCPVIKTWNERNNRGMLGINERLGFARQPAWINFAKVLKEEAG